MSVHLSGTVDGGLPASFGDAGRLEEFAGRLDALAEEVGGLGTDACEATTGVAARAGWSGDAAGAYLNFCRTKSAAVTSLSGPLHEIAAAVRGYAAALAEQRHRVHSAVRSVEGIADPSADAHRISQAEWHVIEATGAADQAVYQAANRVEAAKGEMDRLAPDLEVAPPSGVDEIIHNLLDGALGFAAETAVGVSKGIETAQRVALAQLSEAERLFKDGKLTRAQLRAARLGFLRTLGELDRLPHPLNAKALRIIGSVLTPLDRFVTAINIPLNIKTLINPDDSGLWRLGDRVTAGLSLGGTAATGLSLLAEANGLDEIPFVGEAVIAVDVGVAAYYGIRYVAQNWHTVSHVLDSVGHAEVSFARSGVRLASGVEHRMASSVRSLFRL